MSTENINTGKEIIDATQNAVLEAAENVSELLEEAGPQVSHEHEVFYLSAEFWVAVAFILTVTLLARPIFKVVRAMIIKNIDGIKQRIDDAAQLQNDAEKMLASYERKFRNADQEAETILKKAQNEIEYLRKASLSKMEQEMKQKEKDAEDKLNEAKNKASSEISSLAGSLSVKAVKQALKKNLQKEDLSELIDSSINKIDQAI